MHHKEPLPNINLSNFFGCAVEDLKKKTPSRKRSLFEEPKIEKKQKIDSKPEIKKQNDIASNAPHADSILSPPIKCRFNLKTFKQDEQMLRREELRANSRAYLSYKSEENKWQLINQQDPEDKKLAEGKFAFITHTQKHAEKKRMPSRIVVWSVSSENHDDTFHIGLGFFKTHVSYAGEVIFKNGIVEEWNNASGAYRPAIRLKGAAGLPLEKFTLPKFSY